MVKIQFLTNIQKWAHMAHTPSDKIRPNYRSIRSKFDFLEFFGSFYMTNAFRSNFSVFVEFYEIQRIRHQVNFLGPLNFKTLITLGFRRSHELLVQFDHRLEEVNLVGKRRKINGKCIRVYL